MRPPHWKITPEVPLPRLRTISQLWRLAAVLGIVGVFAMAVDLPLARWISAGHCPAILVKLCALCETFAHAVGIALIAVVIAVLDPWHRHAIPRVLAASLGAGVVANGFKLVVARTRPRHFDLAGEPLDTFCGWMPLAQNTSWDQGFPSSHMAVAAGLAVALACLYPRGRWLFPALAALAGMQRVLSESHFVSDVFWGAAVGCIFAPLCVYGGRLAKAFDLLEARWVVRRQSKEAAIALPAQSPPAVPSGAEKAA